MHELNHQTFSFDDFTLDLTRGCLRRGDREVKLRPKSFAALQYLVENRGRLVSKDELIGAVWPDTSVTDNSLVQCLKEVRGALGDTPQRYIRTVPRRGYIFEARVAEDVPGASLAYTEEVEGVRVVVEEEKDEGGEEKPLRAVGMTLPASVTPRRRRLSRRVLIVPVLLLGVAAALAVFRLRGVPESPGAKPRVRTIAVLPFKPLVRDGGDEYLGLGMADTLITKLGSSTREVIVRPTSAIQKYTSPDQDSLAAGREQRVDAVLEGSIQRSGERVRVTVRLLKVRDGSVLWAHQEDDDFVDIFVVQDAITEKLVGALALTLSGEERRRLAKRDTANAEAYQFYMKGVFLRNQMTEDSLKKSIESFRKAAELDPGYALAYAGQASSYSPLAYLGHIPVSEAESRNRPLIMKALELDGGRAEAHAALAELKLFIERDWEGAEREFKQALELNPSEQLTHLLYPDLLLIKGQPDEAIAMSKAALEIDPLSPRTGKALAWIYFYAGRYDEAIEQFNQTRELFPDYGLINLGPCYEAKGMYEQAVREYLDAEGRWGTPAEEIAALRHAYATTGWRGYWQKRLDLLKAAAQRRPVQAASIAQIYARLGEREQALEWLERAYGERDMSLIYLSIDPAWRGLRSEPGFQDLQRRMRLASRAN